MRSKIPSSTHRWKVRCTLESSGNSLGRRFHWQPVLSRKMIASRTARWSMRRRPVFFGGSCSARIGSISSHSSSGIRQRYTPDGGQRLLFGGALGHRLLLCSRNRG